MGKRSEGGERKNNRFPLLFVLSKGPVCPQRPLPFSSTVWAFEGFPPIFSRRYLPSVTFEHFWCQIGGMTEQGNFLSLFFGWWDLVHKLETACHVLSCVSKLTKKSKKLTRSLIWWNLPPWQWLGEGREANSMIYSLSFICVQAWMAKKGTRFPYMHVMCTLTCGQKESLSECGRKRDRPWRTTVSHKKEEEEEGNPFSLLFLWRAAAAAVGAGPAKQIID